MGVSEKYDVDRHFPFPYRPFFSAGISRHGACMPGIEQLRYIPTDVLYVGTYMQVSIRDREGIT